MAIRTCYKGSDFAQRIRRALGVEVGQVSCHIVDDPGMRQVMRHAGWTRNEDVEGVVGFQVNQNIYVRDDSKWTTLHELIHRAGINADRISRFVAEGLVEVIAGQLKQGPDEHQPTYPDETRWVKDVLLPKLGMTAFELGSAIAKAGDPPRYLADLLVKRDPTLVRDRLLDELKPQRPGRPSIGGSQNGMIGRRTCVHCRGRCPSLPSRALVGSLTVPQRPVRDSAATAEGVGAVLVVLGAALLLRKSVV